MFCEIYSRKLTYAVSDEIHIKKLSLLGYPAQKMIFIDVILSPESHVLIIPEGF